MQQTLIEFFTAVLQGDKPTLGRIAQYEGDIYFDTGSDVLIFRLEDLHGLLFSSHELEFSDFKKQLYQGNLNQELGGYGGRVEVHQSTGKVDYNYYRLVKIQGESPGSI